MIELCKKCEIYHKKFMRVGLDSNWCRCDCHIWSSYNYSRQKGQKQIEDYGK